MRKWLTNNKIFFEICSTLLFGLASIYLATAANNVSQNQLELAKLTLRPHIFVSEKYSVDETGVAMETLLEANNAGAPVYDFSINTRTFYTVRTDRDTIWIPVMGYYNATFKMDAVSGKLAEVRGVNNNNDFADLYKEHMNLSTFGELGHTELARVTIVQILYETRSREIFEEYFIGETHREEPRVKEMFQSHSVFWALEVSELKWSNIVEAALKIRTDAPVLIREERYDN